MSGTIELQDSNCGGTPITLYLFTRGTVQYAYNSSDQDIDYSGVTYAATPVSDGGFVQSGESEDDNIKIELPWASELVALYNGTPPSDEVFVMVFDYDFNDAFAYLVWSGSITEVTRKDPATAEITCRTIGQSFERDGLTLSYGRNCPYFLYDQTTCGVNPASFVQNGIVSAVSGQTVECPALEAMGDLYFNGGYIEWQIAEGTFERRPILLQVGDTATLIGLADSLSVGQSINCYPGCDRTAETCETKFNNLANCGCCNKLPGQSPFDQVNFF